MWDWERERESERWIECSLGNQHQCTDCGHRGCMSGITNHHVLLVCTVLLSALLLHHLAVPPPPQTPFSELTLELHLPHVFDIKGTQSTTCGTEGRDASFRSRWIFPHPSSVSLCGHTKPLCWNLRLLDCDGACVCLCWVCVRVCV